MPEPATAVTALSKVNTNNKGEHTQMRIYTLILIMLMLSVTAYAQLDTIDTDAQTVTFSLAGQNTNSTTAVTASMPIAPIDGHSAIYISRQTAEGKVISEVFNAEIEGAWKFVEGFVEVERDLHRGIERNVQTGYRLTPGTLTLGPVKITGGAGNFTANTATSAPAPAITFGWTAYTTIDAWRTRTTVTAEPEIDFNAVQVDIESTLRHAIDRNFEIGVTVKGYFDSHPPTDGRFHSQYLLFATWKPRR